MLQNSRYGTRDRKKVRITPCKAPSNFESVGSPRAAPLKRYASELARLVEPNPSRTGPANGKATVYLDLVVAIGSLAMVAP